MYTYSNGSMMQGWVDVTRDSFLNVWGSVIGFLPSLIGALVILVLGLIVAAVVRYLVEQVVRAIRLDVLLRNVGVEAYFSRAGFSLNSAKFFGHLFYWFVVVVFVVAITDALRLYDVSLFLRQVVEYIKNIIVAILVMLITVVIANFVRSLVRASVMSARLEAAKFLGTLSWWAIVVFGLLVALYELNVAQDIVKAVVTGLIYMFTIAGGIAFGLGGKDYAAHLIERLREETEGE